MRRLVIVLASGATIAACAIACGSKPVPTPPYVRQTTSELTEVPYPPPPARVELLPPRPRGHERAVWIDGEWQWQGRRWAWRRGRWVEVPQGAAFSPWATVRDASGTLYVAAGVWRGADGGIVPDPPPIEAGRPTVGSMVNPEAEPIGPAPIVPADAAPLQLEDAAVDAGEEGGDS